MKVTRQASATLLGALSFALLVPVRAQVSLFEYSLNVDGAIGTTLPAGSSLDLTTGLGTVALSFNTPGKHYGSLFVDHELDESLNTFFNEFGSRSQANPPAGLSWEIDEPGFVFGDIYDHFEAGKLDNSIGTADPDDVSMSLGWSVDLLVGQSAELKFLLTEDRTQLGAGAFYLRHWDPDSGSEVFFTAQMRIQGGPVVPEPGFGMWGSLGLAGACWAAVRRRRV